MASTTLPDAFPPLLAASLALAREAYAAERAAWGADHWAYRTAFDDQSAAWLRRMTLAQESLVADLTRPASRDHWLRWLAARVGLDGDGVCAPAWTFTSDSYGECWWLLRSGTDTHVFTVVPLDGHNWTLLTKGWSLDPVEALTSALLTVGSAP